MRKQCAVCSEPFEAKRNTAKYCSKRCNVRAARQPKREAVPAPTAAVAGLAMAAQAKLAAAGRLDGPEGQAVMILAARLDASGAETGAGVASLVRQFHASLAEALRDAAREADPVEDELEAARERRRALTGR